MDQKNRASDQPTTGRPVGAEPLPLLTTELYRPPVRPDLERRSRLLERLEQNRYRPLTLISAPAGYGKTMLASMWLEACGCPSAWISLDEADNDLMSFTSYLLAALQSTFPTLELKTLSLLEAPVLPPATVLARYLLHVVEQMPEPFILALDGVHLIRDQAILDLLSEVLRYPPQAMHLVLIGRRDPPLPIASLGTCRRLAASASMPDVIVMDMVMPEGDGATATRALLDAYPDVHVLVLTGFNTCALIHKALRAGASGYLHKNASIDELADAIRAACAWQVTLAPEAMRALVEVSTQ